MLRQRVSSLPQDCSRSRKRCPDLQSCENPFRSGFPGPGSGLSTVNDCTEKGMEEERKGEVRRERARGGRRKNRGMEGRKEERREGRG